MIEQMLINAFNNYIMEDDKMFEANKNYKFDFNSFVKDIESYRLYDEEQDKWAKACDGLDIKVINPHLGSVTVYGHVGVYLIHPDWSVVANG